MRTWAIVVAAGGGARFGGAKQFVQLGGVSVVERAVAVARDACDGVVVVPRESAAEVAQASRQFLDQIGLDRAKARTAGKQQEK